MVYKYAGVERFAPLLLFVCPIPAFLLVKFLYEILGIYPVEFLVFVIVNFYDGVYKTFRLFAYAEYHHLAAMISYAV